MHTSGSLLLEVVVGRAAPPPPAARRCTETLSAISCRIFTICRKGGLHKHPFPLGKSLPNHISLSSLIFGSKMNDPRMTSWRREGGGKNITNIDCIATTTRGVQDLAKYLPPPSNARASANLSQISQERHLCVQFRPQSRRQNRRQRWC